MWELFLSQKCVRSPCKLTISSTSTALKDLSFFCRPIGRVENPEENVRGLVVMKQHPSSVWQPSHLLCVSSFLTLQMRFSPSTRKRFPHCMIRRKERRRTVEDKPLQVHCSLISSTNRPKHDSSSFYGAPLESELQHIERYLGRLKPIDCCLIWIYTGASKFFQDYTRKQGIRG